MLVHHTLLMLANQWLLNIATIFFFRTLLILLMLMVIILIVLVLLLDHMRGYTLLCKADLLLADGARIPRLEPLLDTIVMEPMQAHQQ